MTNDNLTNFEKGVLAELVYNVLDSMQTDGNDTADNPDFIAYSNLYRKLGGTPPAPHQEDEITPTARQSAIGLAEDLIDIARNAGEENE